MKNLKLITFCKIVFLSQNLIGQTVFADAGSDIELTIDLTIDSRTASIQLKVPTQNDLGIAGVEYMTSQEAGKDITDRTERHSILKELKFGTAARKMKPLVWLYNNLMYLVLMGIGFFASVLMWQDG